MEINRSSELIDKMTGGGSVITMTKGYQWHRHNNKNPHDETRTKTNHRMTTRASKSFWFIKFRSRNRRDDVNEMKNKIRLMVRAPVNSSIKGDMRHEGCRNVATYRIADWNVSGFSIVRRLIKPWRISDCDGWDKKTTSTNTISSALNCFTTFVVRRIGSDWTKRSQTLRKITETNRFLITSNLPNLLFPSSVKSGEIDKRAWSFVGKLFVVFGFDLMISFVL